jgi:hypothetical protein
MSWLRTQLLSLGVGLLLVKLGEGDGLSLQFIGAILVITAICGVFYSRLRFTKLLKVNEPVEHLDINAKRVLSVIIALSALAFSVNLVSRLFV